MPLSRESEFGGSGTGQAMRGPDTQAYGGPTQGHGQPMPYGPQAWGWRGPGWQGRRPHPIETKPFFLTSEFFVVVAAVIGLIITTAVNENFDAPLFWILTTALLSFYMLSRGIAKSGTKSRSVDPREQLLDRGARSDD